MTHVNDYYTPDEWNRQELLIRSGFSFFNAGVAPLPNKTGYISGNMYQPTFYAYVLQMSVVSKDPKCLKADDNTPASGQSAKRRRWWSTVKGDEYFRLFWRYRLIHMQLILHESKGKKHGKTKPRHSMRKLL